jgi:hypothetical protein
MACCLKAASLGELYCHVKELANSLNKKDIKFHDKETIYVHGILQAPG